MSPAAPRVRVVTRLHGLDGVELHEAIDADGRPIPGPRVALVGRQHGNEPVGELAIERFVARAPAHLVRGAVVTVLANLDARALDLRHTPDGLDMNRLWDADRLARLAAANPAALRSEERRVRAIAPVVLGCDAILDLHSTSRPAPAHLLYRDDHAHARVAARLGVARLVTGVHENAVLDGGVCANAGLRPGEAGPRLGFTLEAGQHGAPENLERAWSVVVRLLVALDLWDEALPELDVVHEVYDLLERVRQAPAGTPPWRFVGWTGGEPGGGRRGNPRSLASFEVVEADEIVLRRGEGEVVRAEGPFTMLMPAPTAGPGEDLYFVAQRRHLAPEARPATDAAARAEAHAVERLLDVLGWDEAERGATTVATTSRRVLDLCAELVGRVARLPAGHPHRRVTLIGRGEDGGDEAELRASARWRAALRRARADGVPIERIQLLRGATLAGLRARAAEGDALRLSLTQPPTLAAVIAGDVDAALRTGELRHVAVAMVVETASPEVDGDDVHVRVDRAALVGGRPELLRTAIALRDALRSEHELALRVGLLGEAPVGPDGAFRGDDEAGRAALADALVGLQTRRWRGLLEREVTRPLRLARGAVGPWLARLVGGTGLLDVDALRAWLLRPDGEGAVVEPARLAVDPVVPPRSPPPLPEPVLDARSVDRDDIERFLGWRRWLREAELLSGDRGRDLELVTVSGRVDARMARWLDDARARAAARPGRVLVALAGDGFVPREGLDPDAARLLAAHRRALLDPSLRYLRVLHGPGSHLGWVKDLVDAVARRGDGAPVGLGWEREHGGSLHVLLVASVPDAVPDDAWTLEPWRIERCAVLLARDPDEGGAPLALLTGDDDEGRPHAELVHFGRQHLERLMRRATWRFVGQGGPSARVHLEAGARALLADQIGRLSAQLDLLGGADGVVVDAWAAHRLGLHDPALAREVVRGVRDGASRDAASRRLWDGVAPWPGPRVG